MHGQKNIKKCVYFAILTAPFSLSFTCLSERDVTRKVVSKASIFDICLLAIRMQLNFCLYFDGRVSISRVTSDTSCAVA